VVFRGWYNPEHNDDLKRMILICKIARRELSPEEAAAEAAITQQLHVSSKCVIE
jgi:hypothetical protein